MFENEELNKDVMSAFGQPEGMMEQSSESLDKKTVIIAPPVIENSTQGASDGSGNSESSASTTVETTEEFKYNPIWDQYATKFNSEDNPFQIPEEVKTGKLPENMTEMDMFLSSAIKHLNPTREVIESLPDTLKDYLVASSQENFDERKWLEERLNTNDIMKMPNEDLMFNHLKSLNGKSETNPDGWDEEAITKQVDAMKNSGVLDLQAIAIKKQIQAEQNSASANKLQELDKIEQSRIEKFRSEQKTIADTTLQKNQHLDDFFGIKFSQAELAQFHKDFPKMVDIDPKERVHTIHKWLQSDENVYKVAALIWKGDQGVRDYISGMKEAVKQQVLDKTGIMPKEKTGTASAGPGAFDITAFNTPEPIREQYIS